MALDRPSALPEACDALVSGVHFQTAMPRHRSNDEVSNQPHGSEIRDLMTSFRFRFHAGSCDQLQTSVPDVSSRRW